MSIIALERAMAMCVHCNMARTRRLVCIELQGFSMFSSAVSLQAKGKSGGIPGFEGFYAKFLLLS